MLIIGFGNKAQNGKDTCAEAVQQHFNRLNELNRRHLYKLSAKPVNVGIFKFATALYKEVADFIGSHSNQGDVSYATETCFRRIALGTAQVPSHDGYDVTYITIPKWVTMGDPTPAPGLTAYAPYGKHPKLLQWWGTEYRRNNFGEDYWVNKLFSSIPANTDIALVSDARFLNEVDGIKQRGGYTINVKRLRKDGSQYFSADRPVDHPSETALDNYNWDFRIENREGHVALTAELAITYAEYLRGLHS